MQYETGFPEQVFSSFGEAYLQDEDQLVRELAIDCHLPSNDRELICDQAKAWVEKMRSELAHPPLVDAFLQEFGLSSHEGVILMRLAESLIRTPDFETGRYLCRDKLADADWGAHAKKSSNTIVNLATRGMQAANSWIKLSGGVEAKNLLARLGDTALYAAVSSAIALLGQHFVISNSIGGAIKRSQKNNELGSSFLL